MLARFASSTFVLAIALAAPRPAAADGATQVGETGEAIVARVREAHDSAGFRGAVLAARGGKVIAAVAVGELTPGGEPIAIDSLFELASCTKPFTAIAVMKLAEEGALSLDDPIADHLPGVPDDCRAIKVRHLVQHTSGIPRTNSRGAGTDLAKVLPTFLEGGPRTTPGTRHAYWNQGYALLSEVIARASGEPYTRYLRKAVLKPAKMDGARFTGQRAPRGVAVVTGESTRGAARTALEHPYGEYGFQYRGMGGLCAGLVDLWKWDRALAKGILLSEESYEQMTTPGDAGYALGWRVRTLRSGETVHEHTGSVRGFLCAIRRNPADDGCLFVLAASDDQAPFHLVKASCEALLEGRPAPPIVDAAERQIDEALLDQIVGEYRDARGRTFTVTRDGAHARGVIDWGGPQTRGYLAAGDGPALLFAMMRRYDPTGFAEADRVAAVRDEGRVIALELTIVESGSTIRFDRVE